MNTKIQANYQANVHFEISVAINGQSYLIIYGEHINGFFCCIPTHNWGCEMSDPADTYYNANRLQCCGADTDTAASIANVIKETANKYAEKQKSLLFSLEGEL
jgi:hypothetical protein